MRPFEYLEPKTLEDALHLLDQYGNGGKVLAGGTDLLVQLKQKLIQTKYVINIKKIAGLSFIEPFDNKALRIGPLTTFSTLSSSEIVQNRFKVISEASRAIGTPQVRSIATIGGNICHASPSADMSPALMTLQSQVKIESIKGQRVVPIENFFIGPYQTCLNFNELLTEIILPSLPIRSTGLYTWIPKYMSVDETLVGCAVFLHLDSNLQKIDDVAIGLGSAAPTPMRAVEAENFLRGKGIGENVFEKAGEIASGESKPIARFGISSEYRREMVKRLVIRNLKKAAEEILKSN